MWLQSQGKGDQAILTGGGGGEGDAAGRRITLPGVCLEILSKAPYPGPQAISYPSNTLSLLLLKLPSGPTLGTGGGGPRAAGAAGLCGLGLERSQCSERWRSERWSRCSAHSLAVSGRMGHCHLWEVLEGRKPRPE